ncbi:Uncharacterized conserved protein YecE, DUF72 family [Hymenobacter gelipurpurascens]|uniref:Uncharacterized conserved protein YecE, DUF72 family n=1 Tax=Hymenobacter gelipurpurascens TaxID=89968 RepID=A0A212TQT5_9BACT|nr:DUF72 domain-containing protein [Hymenobacter gelipurpurascens]SNC68369.1 Uncharacterized conserved protein YecE, DUF72 family [Hymenobacter gelipurpurascens]
MPEIHIGCSGFHYRDWKGVFYPPELPPRKWFGYYCTQFNTLELNVTFYKMPELKALETWYDQSPEGFQFAVKAPRIVTHYKKFNAEAAPVLADFYGTVREGLREKLGPILFQLPPKAAYTEELMGRMLENLDPEFNNFVEFRHPSWWEGEVFRELARHHISFVGQSHPMPLPDEVVANTDMVYYRFHGVPELYKSSYSEEFLQRIADEIQAAPSVKQAYVYFNNGIGGAGVLNAYTLRKLLEGTAKVA